MQGNVIIEILLNYFDNFNQVMNNLCHINSMSVEISQDIIGAIPFLHFGNVGKFIWWF